jgi:hypothetical protein
LAAALTTTWPAIAERPPAPARPPAPQLFEPGGVTLEDVVVALWDELVAEGRAECPVCGGSITRSAACGSCGAELS